MGDYIPVYADNDQFTRTASAAITGGQLVEVTGNGTVGPAGAASTKVIGVAAHDAASGAKVSVYCRDTLHETTVGTSGDMLAGDQVKAGAAGTIVKDASPAVLVTIGVCTTGATATNLAQWMGY